MLYTVNIKINFTFSIYTSLFVAFIEHWMPESHQLLTSKCCSKAKWAFKINVQVTPKESQMNTFHNSCCKKRKIFIYNLSRNVVTFTISHNKKLCLWKASQQRKKEKLDQLIINKISKLNTHDYWQFDHLY